MIYLKRLAAVIVVLFALIIFCIGYPFFAVSYIATGKDLSFDAFGLMAKLKEKD